MSYNRIILLLSSVALFATSAIPAMARVDVGIDIGVPPPVPQVEVIPPAQPGFVWAPGYWSWEGGQHVWIGGRWMPERRGYRWVPDRWEQRGDHHHFEPGHWDRG